MVNSQIKLEDPKVDILNQNFEKTDLFFIFWTILGL